MLRFSLFGIPIVVQPWFWATLALFGGAISARDPESILRVVLFILAGFLSILVHELGHALTAKSFGAWPNIVLQAFGGYATYDGRGITRGKDLLITAAGPAVQILLGLIFLGVLLFVPLPTPPAQAFVEFVAVISIFWAVLNLVPVIPLDGGRLVAAMLGPGKQLLAHKISIVTAIAAGVGSMYYLNSFIFPIFMLLMAHQNWQAVQYLKR